MSGTQLRLSLLIILNHHFQGIDMGTGIRKLLLATAPAFLIGMGGMGMSHAGNVAKIASSPSGKLATSESSQHPQAVSNLSKDDIREAQLELRHVGLYNGSLDGVIGPQTKQALARFQKDNGLGQTATLDAHTMVAMFGNIGTSQGSSMAPDAGQGTGE
jgi:Putative peptidoglycan binding domain